MTETLGGGWTNLSCSPSLEDSIYFPHDSYNLIGNELCSF